MTTFFPTLTKIACLFLLLTGTLFAQEDGDWYSYEEENREVDGHYASVPWDADDHSYHWASHPIAQRIVVAKGIHIKGLRVMIRAEVGAKFRVVVRNTVSKEAVLASSYFEFDGDEEAEGWEVSYEDIDLGFNLGPGSYFVYPEVVKGQIAFIPDYKVANFQSGLFRIYDGMYSNKQLAKEWIYEFSVSQDQEAGAYSNYGPFFRWLIRPAESFEIIEKDTSGLAELNALVGSEDTIPEKYAEAFEAIQLEIDNSPASIDLYNKRGMAYSNVGKYDLAIRDFDQALKLDSVNQMAFTNRGMTYAKMGEFERAIEDFNAVILLDPQDPLIYYIKGFLERQVGRLDDAIFDFTTSMAFNPRDALTFYMRARTKGEKGDYSGALQDFDHALLIDPNYWAVFKYRALLQVEMGSYEEAIKDFDRALSMNSKDTTVYFLRGNAHLILGNYDLAAADYSKVIEQNPSDISALTNRAQAYGEGGKIQEALADYGEILVLEPANYQTYFNRGKLYLSNKEPLKACADFVTASNSPSKELDDLMKENKCGKYK